MMLKRFCLLWALLIVIAPGCGKKKAKTDKKNATKAEKVVQNENKEFEIPLCKEEDEKLLAQDAAENVDDFAFVDKENDAKVETAKIAENDDESEDDYNAISENKQSFKTVFFNFDKHDIRDDQQAAVRENANIAQDATKHGKKLVIEGHTCQLGSAAYNMVLSQRRAETVKTELVKSGVPATSIKTVGIGAERPQVWSDKNSSRSEMIKVLSPNRRAEIH